MLELLIFACLLDRPKVCHEVALTYLEESLTPYQCMMKSPIEIAKWNEANPKWYAKKWTCRPAGRFAKI